MSTGSSLSKKEYRAAKTGLVTRTTEVEVEDEDRGYPQHRYYGVGVFGPGVGKQEETVLQKYGHGKTGRAGEVYQPWYGRTGRTGRSGEVDEHEREHERDEKEHRPWHVI